ncbi:MAG TPA: hypothetical protein VJB57_06545 [Dehalococcoidia bacterium]|nr:hypothetical protein [Dehalococcoidia bacterium]
MVDMVIDDVELRVSAQRALLGTINDGVLAVWMDAAESEIKVRVFVDRALSDDERDSLEASGTEISADFPWGTTLDFRIIYQSTSKVQSPSFGLWVYQRYGCSLEISPDVPWI